MENEKKILITIGRQSGSAGRRIGFEVGKALGIPCYDREIISEAAKAHGYAEEFIERHHRRLKFDPVERTPRWEEAYYEAERECDRRLGDTPRGMGFCFSHWSIFRQVLAERGIHWRTPSELNPRVMFD